MSCVACGAQLPDAALYCSECGTRQPDQEAVGEDEGDGGQAAGGGRPSKRRNLEFRRWLEERLAEKGWTRSDLARATGYVAGQKPQRGFWPAQVSAWLNGVRVPEPEQCRRLADALGVDPRTVLRLNGHLSPEPDDNPLVADLIAKLRWAQPDEREARLLTLVLEGIGRDKRRAGGER